jgi:hypothetical protein
MNGYRQHAAPARKERLKTMETKLTNLEMASRISQMMTQQLMQSMKSMQEDLGRALGLLNEMQYKLLAIQELSGLDVVRLNELTNVRRLNDFNEASDKADVEGGFTVGTTVEANSTVVLTSTTKETDRGIFRSRIELAKCGVPELINAFMGKEVGTKVVVKLNELEHEVELLGIRVPPPAATAPAEAETVANDGETEVALLTEQAQDTQQVVNG